MAGEIINTLGFDTEGALAALRNLDQALQSTGAALGTFGGSIAAFNAQGASALTTMRALATAATRLATASQSMGSLAAAQPGSQFGLPSGVQSSAQQAASALAAAGAAGRTAGQQVTSGMNTAASATAEVATQSQGLTVSWTTLGRVVMTQAIVRALSLMRNAFNNAVTAAVQFEKQMALIQTIEPTATFERTAAAVRKLSDAYNIPLAEAGAGVYQAISNQVGDFAQSLEFTAEAAKFAKATNSSLKDSVDLLSGALASYGLTVQDTSKVSGIFFSLIDKGRVTATEIANKFGTVGPLAGQLGIQLEDVTGALAAVSVKGSNSAHSLTMLRGILVGLQKPTPELTKEFDRLGFATVETATATEHLDGLLKSVTAGKGSLELGKLFPNTRATSGVSSLAADFKTLINDIEAARKAGANFAQEKFLVATSTNAETMTAELNRLRNALAVDLGRSVLQTIVNISKLVGGVDEVIRVVQTLGPVLLGVGGGFLTLRASIAAAHLEAKGLAKVLGLLALVPVAIGVGTSIGQWVGDKWKQEAFSTLRARTAADKEALDEFKRQQSEKRDAAKKTDEAIIQSELRVIQTLNQSYLADVANAKRANDAHLKNTGAHLNKMLQTQEQLVQELAKKRVEAEEGSKTSQARVVDLWAKIEEREFTQKIRPLDDAEKVHALISRSSDLAARAARDLVKAAKAGDQGAMDRALALFGTAQRVGEEAQTIAQRGEDRSLEVDAARELESVTYRQISAERELQNILQARIAPLKQQEETQRAVVDSMRDAIKVLLDNSKLFTKEGQLLPTEQLGKQAEARQEALRTIAKAALTSKDLTALGALGLADFVSRFSSELTTQPIKLHFEVESELQRIQSQLTKSFSEFKVRFEVERGISVEGLETLLGRQFQNPDDVAKGLVQVKKRAAEVRVAFDAQQAAQRGANQTLATSAAATDEALDRVVERLHETNSGAVQLAQRAGIKLFPFEQTQTAVDALRAALADPQLTLEKLKAAAAEIEPLADRSQFAFGGFANTKNVLDLTVALEALQQRLTAIKTLQAPSPATTQPDTTQLDTLKAVEEASRQAEEAGRRTSEATQGAATGAKTTKAGLQDVAALDMSGLTGSIQNAAWAMWDLAMASWSVEVPAGSAAAMEAAHGGKAWKFLAGGGAVGTDVIPAMLAPGEMVINAASARNFASQLTAINAGVQPVYRSEGGSVTNIGDINVTVNGGGSGRQTARSIATELRRELRRGASTL